MSKIRHIIVEGPDGSGKGNLIRDLSAHLGLPVHPRFVQSTGGPPENLAWLVEQDIQTPAFSDMHHTWIYDRHPIISEPIYGPIVRGEMKGSFGLPSWLIRMQRRIAARCIVVWCLPPLSEVVNNVTSPADGIEHMAGVQVNIREIYQAYNEARLAWKDGPSIVHNYVLNPPGSSNRGILIGRVRRMAQEGEREWRTNPR